MLIIKMLLLKQLSFFHGLHRLLDMPMFTITPGITEKVNKANFDKMLCYIIHYM